MLQSFCAQAALFLLPLPALKHPSTTLTLADLFLVPAIVLNLGYALRRLHGFQIPLLLAFPLFLLSHMLDPDGELIPLLQVCYLWGFVVPFGWCAFVNIPLRRIALLLLGGNALSAVVGAGQFMGIIPMLPTQYIIEFRSEFRRAAGLMLQCNSLAMALTPCFLLLSYLPRIWPRILVCLTLLAGFISTVSKSMVLAAPGMVFYFFREPQKGKLLKSMLILAMLGVGGIKLRGGDLMEIWNQVNQAAEHRLGYADYSVQERSELIMVALEYSQECLFVGFGTGGTVMRLARAEGNTVHMFYLGLVMVAGYPATILVVSGFLMIAAGLWKQREWNVAIFLLSHMLAITVMTLLYLTFQSMPVVVAASVFAANQFRAEAGALALQASRRTRRLAA